MARKIILSEEQTQLYNDLKKLVKRANQRLVRLERAFGTDTWGMKRVRDKLDIEPLKAWTSKGRIRLNKSYNIQQLNAIKNITEKFLSWETSTVSGVKNIRKRAIKSLAKKLSTEEKEVTYEDAETYYELFEEEEWKWVLRYMTESEYYGMVQDAKEDNDTEEQWVERFKTVVDFGNDLDFKERVIQLYYKHV